MKLLALETSCDETAFAIFDFTSEREFTILSEQLNSQIDIHQEYGGVFPAVAKREHTKNLYPLLIAALDESGLLIKRTQSTDVPQEIMDKLHVLLERDPDNLELLVRFYEQYEFPDIDAVAVTYGPGLEMALWTGFNFARALSHTISAELVPTNHMEGHIYASLITQNEEGVFTVQDPQFPNLNLLISGGHTELVLATSEHNYTKIGKTLDDAVGEAYDKSARLLGIPYPGGPQISKLADEYRSVSQSQTLRITLPRPMLHTKDYDFSFSGLKTAVLTQTQKQDEITNLFKQELSFELEESIAEVLIKKTKRAITEYGVSSLIIGGGVSANNHLREKFTELCEQERIKLFLPEKKYTGDNAVMIGIAGYRRFINKKYPKGVERVLGRLSLED